MTTVHRPHVSVRRASQSAGALHLGRIPGGMMMRSDAAASYTRMYASARKAGVNLQPVSAYRSTAQQARLYKLYRQGRGNLAARPGRSNHEKGIAVDVAVGSTRSKAYKWLHAHAAQFGFKRTVPIEPWHWEFRR